MPARVLVYCKSSVLHVTREMLDRELRDADLTTLVETLELPEGEEEAVEEMWKHYELEASSTAEGGGAEIRWHARQRPIQISWRAPLDGEIEETLEDLPDSDSPGAERVRRHLAATREVVSFEMGIDGSNHLAATISEVLSFFFAEQGDGLVWFYHRDFASPDDRGETLWATE